MFAVVEFVVAASVILMLQPGCEVTLRKVIRVPAPRPTRFKESVVVRFDAFSSLRVVCPRHKLRFAVVNDEP